MQINFTQIFQDSLNFMRNQRKTVLLFVGIFVISQLINALVSVPMPSLGDNPNPSQQDIIDALSKVEPTALIGSFLFQQLLMSFIATFGIATIHHISLQNENPINQGLMLTLRRFLGVVVLDIFMSLPLLFWHSGCHELIFKQKCPLPSSLCFNGIWFIFLCSPMLIACALHCRKSIYRAKCFTGVACRY